MRSGSRMMVGAMGIVSLMLVSSAPPQVAIKKVTFTKDVAPILYQNCVTCHRPGEVAPFSLLTYTDAKRWAPMIAQTTGNHIMPPWKAAPGFGDFADARVLSDAQIATLKEWSKSGTLEG